MKSYLSVFLKGMAMGVAEVIPGVSGGTIAFITGIYETLIGSLKSFTPALLPIFRQQGVKGVWQAINGNFLLALFGGMAASILSFVHLITWLIETYPVLLWAFFFGLIVASTYFVGKKIARWDALTVGLLLVGTALAYYITIASPANGNEALWFVFLSGTIAISAMLLPGLSGSFVLLLMGMYFYIFDSLKSLYFPVIFTFATGCLVGVLSFSHVLAWAFKHYHNATLALLTGFMVGSLNKVWPWRNVIATRLNSKGEAVPFLEKSVLPTQFEGDPYLLGVVLLVILGVATVLLLENLGKKNEE